MRHNKSFINALMIASEQKSLNRKQSLTKTTKDYVNNGTSLDKSIRIK